MRTYLKDFNRLDADETPITVEYTVSKRYRAVLWGDNSRPAEGGEIEIIKAWGDLGRVTITDVEEEKFRSWLEDNHKDAGSVPYDNI
jgi:hypothetical protein